MAPRLHVVIAGTRPGRLGPSVARWSDGSARRHGGFEPALVDPAAFGPPVSDGPEHPVARRHRHGHTRRWGGSVAAADAYAFVWPEHNHFPPPSLANALDHPAAEWTYKPAGPVGYGGVSGGPRAARAVEPPLTAHKAVPVPEGVAVPNFQRFLDGGGTFRPDGPVGRSATAMLGEPLRWAGALEPLRAA